MRIAAIPSILALATVLPGCSADREDYPSLARRPIERAAAAEPVPAPEGTAASAAAPRPSPVLDGLVEQARSAHARFLARRGKAEQLANAARGAPVGGESWAAASLALADLEAARSEAMIALADLDGRYAAARIDGADPRAIAAARDRVMAWIGDEDRILAGLSGKPGG